jgi:phospholipid/cholesterol/gamma-HCH transport system permease protein
MPRTQPGIDKSRDPLLVADPSGDAHSDRALTLRLKGDWSIDRLKEIEQQLASIDKERYARVRVDVSKLHSLELSAAWLLRQRLQEFSAHGAEVEFVGSPPSQLTFVDEIAAKESGEPKAAADIEPVNGLVARIGKYSVEQKERGRAALEFYGRVFMTGASVLAHPRRLRLASVARHVYETGIQAVPIVALIAFLITLVIAYIGAQQLSLIGGEIFTVDLVTVGVLREMGVLLTAIIVAGRSGSAFAAEIGVMQLNDEVDALKSIGMDPYEVLVIPRILGLVIALPLLTILADAMGLSGGALLCSWLLDVSIPQFVSRMEDALSPTTFWAGFIKSPVFAFLIAMTGTYRGMQVRDSSRELGRLTTVAVVQSIFLVILANAVFAVIYLEIDF